MCLCSNVDTTYYFEFLELGARYSTILGDLAKANQVRPMEYTILRFVMMMQVRP